MSDVTYYIYNYKNKNRPYLKNTLLGNLRKLNSFKSISVFGGKKNHQKDFTSQNIYSNFKIILKLAE